MSFNLSAREAIGKIKYNEVVEGGPFSSKTFQYPSC